MNSCPTYAARIRRAGFRVSLSILIAAAVAACAPAPISPQASLQDEEQVIAAILSKDFESLRSLESLSEQGIPFAMFWWGALTESCIFEQCDEEEAYALYIRAAEAGHDRATAAAFALVASRAEFDEMSARLGVPTDGSARLAYWAQRTLGIFVFPDDSTGVSDDQTGRQRFEEARFGLRSIAEADREIGLLLTLVVLEGYPHHEANLRALAGAGHPLASGMVRQNDILTGVVGLPNSNDVIIRRARNGGHGIAAAYCDSLALSTGQFVIPAGMLELCEQAAKEGYPAAVRALITHHQFSGNKQATEYYAELCDALIGIYCAGTISEALWERRDESPAMAAKAKFWDLAAANLAAVTDRFTGMLGELDQNELLGSTPDLRRDLFVLRMRSDLIMQACMTMPIDKDGAPIVANPDCPWRKPIAIPDRYMSSGG